MLSLSFFKVNARRNVHVSFDRCIIYMNFIFTLKKTKTIYRQPL